jgi:hypothetical protein
MLKQIGAQFATILVAALAVSIHSAAQTNAAADPKPGTIGGTVIDVNGDTVPGATVVLKGLDANNVRTLVTPENGFFSFQDLNPGVPYQISIAANGFADWTFPTMMLEPGQYKILGGIQLRIEAEHSEVQVTYDPEQAARQEFQTQIHQRVLGIIPNFYVAYDQNAAPLTPKMKFKLALRVSMDPVTATGVFLVSSAKQAADSPKYGQGWDAYAKRVGATAVDGFSDIIIGGAILPSLLHQDPRYFYQGTGSTGSRIRHAMFSPFVARYDDGHYGPNYSSLGGDLASSALSNLYYPRANRGAGLVFSQFAIGTAERIGASLAQEFLIARFTKRGGKVQ